MALSNFALLLISARYLGIEIWGQVNILILNIAIIQTINEIYTGSAIVYFVPKNSLAQIYRHGFLFALASSLTLNLLFWLLNEVDATSFFHLLSLSFIITLNTFHNVLLLAREKIKHYNLMVFAQPALMLMALSIQLFVLNNRTFNAYLFSLYISFGIALLVSAVLLIGLFKTTDNDGKIEFFKVIQNGFMNQLGNLAHTLSNRLNYYLLSSAALVGVYASSTSLIESVLIISGSISPIILSHVANKKDVVNNARLSLALAKLCFVLSLFCVFIIVLLPNELFTFMLGKNFEQTKMVMLYLSPGILCLSFSAILSHYFSGLGRQKILLVANLSGLLIAVCTAWPFINYFGLKGACYAASLAYLAQATVLSVVFFKANKIGIKEVLNPKIEMKLLK